MTFLYFIAYLASSGFVIYIGACLYTDRQIKNEILNEKKRVENEAWVDQLISNIKDEDNELAY